VAGVSNQYTVHAVQSYDTAFVIAYRDADLDLQLSRLGDSAINDLFSFGEFQYHERFPERQTGITKQLSGALQVAVETRACCANRHGAPGLQCKGCKTTDGKTDNPVHLALGPNLRNDRRRINFFRSGAKLSVNTTSHVRKCGPRRVSTMR
jgi:hypothetical protein